jgi:hypothetical protein
MISSLGSDRFSLILPKLGMRTVVGAVVGVVPNVKGLFVGIASVFVNT